MYGRDQSSTSLHILDILSYFLYSALLKMEKEKKKILVQLLIITHSIIIVVAKGVTFNQFVLICHSG